MNIKTVTVIGANGSMGKNVAAIFASFGNAKVFMVGRDIRRVKDAVPKAVASVRADSIEKKLIPTDMSYLEACVGSSDLIFESATESLEVKKEIARRVGSAMKPDAVSCTGSSGLSITELAECYPDDLRSRFFGVHMFNPPYSMPLCELCATKYTDNDVKNRLRGYLTEVLYRTVVEVKDSPAFLANRIGFQFINKAMLAADKYKDNGGIDYIDAILGPFTGRTMPPLVTADFVGLDVHRAIVGNIEANTNDAMHESFVLPDFVDKLVRRQSLGRKTGKGLYQTLRYENGRKRILVYDIAQDRYRDRISYVFPFAEAMKDDIREGNYRRALEQLVNNHSVEARICLGFLLDYMAYSFCVADQVGFRMKDADDVMALGFNWCPPIALADAFRQVTDINALLRERLGDRLYSEIGIDDLLAKAQGSGYDYRKYLKSGR